MCSRKVVVKPLIFRLFRTLPVSQRLRFLCLIIMACETSGIKLQGPSLCIRTHGWKFLSKKLTVCSQKIHCLRRMSSLDFCELVFRSTFCFRISPCWSQHRLGPCSFIPVGDSRHDALNRKLLLRCLSLHPKLISHLRPGLSVRLTFIAKMLYIFR